jgi:iron(III) transport system permease protein
VKRGLPVLLALVPLVAFGLLPIALILAAALGLPRTLDLSGFAAVVTSAETTSALGASVGIALLTTALSVSIGAPAAFALGRLQIPGRRGLKTALTLPAVVPPYLWAIAWIDLANPRTGLLNLFAAALGLSWPRFDCYSALGIAWVLGLSFFPFVLLPVHAALERIDGSLEEAARLAGARPIRVLLGITLPLIAPALAQGAVLVFLGATAAFGVPYLLGTAGTHRTTVLTTAIVERINLGGPEALRQAMALSLALLIVSLGAGGLSLIASRAERRFAVVAGKAGHRSLLDVGKSGRALALAGLLSLVAVAVVLPLATLGLISLLRAFGAGFLPDNWSLENYRRVLFEMHETGPALLRSFTLAALAATLAVLVGGSIAYARIRRPSALTRITSAVANAPYAVPGTVLALGLIFAWSREIRFVVLERVTLVIDLFSGAYALLAAYAIKYLAFGVRTTAGALVQLDPSLEEAARTSGASGARAALDVVVPLIAPALGSAWLLVFLPALSEITMSVLLAGPGTEVVGTVLFELQSYADPPSAAVLATLLVGLTLAGNALLVKLSRGQGGF